MEKRFSELGLSERVRFLEAVDGLALGGSGSDWDKSARGCFASHVEAMRAVANDAEYADTGAIVFEDDVLIHRDFKRLSAEVFENLPAGAEHCLLGYMLAPPNPDLLWTGRDAARRNLCSIAPDHMWGSHCYWVAPERATKAAEAYGDIPLDSLPSGTERMTVPRSGFASWPPLALQEASDSEIRPDWALDECHRRGQQRWPLRHYLGAGDDESSFTFSSAPQPSIGLCMIVRDEADVIERCIRSVDGLINHWTICDTGSADGTPELIEKLLGHLPGDLHRRPWRDFGHNRTELMSLARGSADYLLLLDADMTIDWRGPLPELAADSYELRHEGEPSYWIERLVRGDLEWRFIGATHEHLASPAGHSRRQLRALEVRHHGDGGTRHEKFERDRALLEAELQKNPDSDRATFYLAQTVRDLGETERAIDLYRRRIELGGWDEEVFYAVLQVAELTSEESPRDSIPLFLEAHECRPARAEPLHRAAQISRGLGWHHAAYTFARQAADIPLPDDILFVSRSVYEWGARFELALAAHWTRRHDQARRLYDELLAGELPGSVRASIRENLRRLDNVAGGDRGISRATECSILELVPSARFAELKLEVEPAWPQFNPSIAADGDGFRVIVRTSNYRLDRGSYRVLDGSGEVRTINYVATLDSDLSLTGVESLRDLGSELDWHDFPVRGWEDCRLFQVAGTWLATATSRELHPEGVCRTVLLELDGSRIAAARILDGPDPHRHEKNWMPYAAGNELLFVYSSSPTVVTRVDPKGGQPVEAAAHEAPAGASEFRGGSQGVQVEGGVLFCIHEAFDFGGPRRYLHRWVRFDPDWRLEAVSPRFHFTDNDVEMCIGLARRGDELVASFGIDDHTAALALLDEAEVLGTLQDADAALAGLSG
jgi:tetratricopeptide (TPR) repeat protein